MVFAPEKNNKTFLHFSWYGDSAALRDFSKNTSTKPKPVSLQTVEVIKYIEKYIVPAEHRNIDDIEYWHNEIIKCNKEFLRTEYFSEEGDL